MALRHRRFCLGLPGGVHRHAVGYRAAPLTTGIVGMRNLAIRSALDRL
jgi:hypothetical protein